mgnify:CR=1 FL=1|tara:strand:+ start:434 stop:1672 length:1239 start_codon:yes stop_codon:yes gene_type:complete
MITNKNEGIYGQMNWVFNHFKEGQHILKLDDDISSFKKLQGSKLVKIKNIGETIKKGFQICEQKGLKLFGIYPTANAYFMEGQQEYTTDLRFIVGAFMGIINQKKNKIDLSIKIKGDYEYAINSFKMNGGILRFNTITFNYDIAKNEGERINVMKRDASILMKKYPTLVKDNQRRGDMGEILLARGEIVGGKITKYDDELRYKKDNTEVDIDNIVQTPKVKKLKANLIRLLDEASIPKVAGFKKGEISRGTLIGYKGFTFTLGCGRKRNIPVGEFKANEDNRELMKAVIDYGNEILPTGFGYSVITINKNLKAKKHKDTGNDGVGCITFLGDYTGGGLNLHYGNRKETIPTHNKLICFNGANITHSTEAFKGNRYAMIFYSQANRCKIPGYNMIGNGVLKDVYLDPNSEKVY